MRLAIAVLRLSLILICTALFYLIIILGFIFSLIGLKGKKWIAFFLSLWGKVICRIIGLEVKVEGTPPKPPYFLVSNHLSYIDIFLFISKTKSVFIAKSEVLSWPFFGIMSQTVGMLFVDRTKKTDVKRVNDLISKRISEAQGVLLFPESTTSAGEKILPFKASLLAYPAEMSMPVHYAAIRYSTPEEEIHASESVCWWREVTFSSHFIDLLKLKKIYGTINFGDEPIMNNDRKKLAADLHDKVEQQFTPVIDKLEHAE